MTKRSTRSRSSPRSVSEAADGLLPGDWLDAVERRLPEPIRGVVHRARRDDIMLFAAGLGFYALVSLAPLVIVIMWVAGLILGEQRLQQAADQLGRTAPKGIGADQALRRVAETGTQIGWLSVVTALWPASAYGAGLQRAFQRLSPKKDPELGGLKGRVLLLLLLLPVLVLGSLAGSYLGTTILKDGAVSTVVGWLIALVTGFIGAAAGTMIVLRIFPQERLSWGAIWRGTAVTAGGVSLLSVVLVIYLNLGANFQEHYATSSVAGVVMVALWLFLSNVMLLVGYKFALET